jgi:hypothetical protein
LPSRGHILPFGYGGLRPLHLRLWHLRLRLLPSWRHVLPFDYGGLRPLHLRLWHLRLRLLPSWRHVLPFDDCGLRNGILLRRTLWSSADRRLNTPDSAHVHDANRRTRSRRTLAYLLDLSWRKRATGILR